MSARAVTGVSETPRAPGRQEPRSNGAIGAPIQGNDERIVELLSQIAVSLALGAPNLPVAVGPDEAARLLGISRDTLDEQVIPNGLRVCRIGRRLTVGVDELRRWHKANSGVVAVQDR
jgi:excisionase family DNA binding protein